MKILGIFRGFPGLGRVVAGVSLLETIKMNYNCEIKIICKETNTWRKRDTVNYKKPHH